MSRIARIRCVQLFAALAALLALSVAYAGDAAIVYYDIGGNTANALRHQMDAKGRSTRAASGSMRTPAGT